MNEYDQAVLTAIAVNDPKGLESRQRELRARLRNDPRVPETPKWTRQEMTEAAQRLMSSVLKTGKLVS